MSIMTQLETNQSSRDDAERLDDPLVEDTQYQVSLSSQCCQKQPAIFDL